MAKSVSIHLYSQSEPIVISGVVNTYQKGDLFCVMRQPNVVDKFPIQHIFRITESDSD